MCPAGPVPSLAVLLQPCFHNSINGFVQPAGKSDAVAGIPVLGHIKTICNKSLFAVTLEFRFQLLLHLSSVFILINFHSFFYSGSFFFPSERPFQCFWHSSAYFAWQNFTLLDLEKMQVS